MSDETKQTEQKPANKKNLSAADILSSPAPDPITVYVKDWNGYITFRPLTAAEALKFANDKSNNHAAVSLIITSAINPETGDPLFSRAHAEELGRKSLRAVSFLQDILLKYNGLKEGSLDGVEEGKGV